MSFTRSKLSQLKEKLIETGEFNFVSVGSVGSNFSVDLFLGEKNKTSSQLNFEINNIGELFLVKEWFVDGNGGYYESNARLKLSDASVDNICKIVKQFCKYGKGSGNKNAYPLRDVLAIKI